MSQLWDSEGELMQVHYKHNGQDAVYADYRLPTIPRESSKPLCGPFEQCADCPYPGHGFICWRTDKAKCLRTEMARIMERDKLNMEAAPMINRGFFHVRRR